MHQPNQIKIMKRDKIIYWIFTGLLSLWMAFQGVMFIFSSEQIAPMFEGLNMPTALIIPLGVAKLLAVGAILSKKSDLLKKLAYYGLAIDFIAAIASHFIAGDGQGVPAIIALVILVVSYIYDRKLF